MTPEELRERTLDFAEAVTMLAEPLFASISTRDSAAQLSSAASSAGANYRAACVARSHAEFCAKLGIALEEADEAVYWLELLHRTGRGKGPAWEAALNEGRQLAKILGASARTSTGRRDDSRRRPRPRPRSGGPGRRPDE